MPKTITITKEDFDNAVTQAMGDSMEDPRLRENAEALMLFTLGGVAFVRKVGDILFRNDCEDENE